MAESSRIAKELRRRALQGDDPQRRTASMLDFLRRELENVPLQELYATLAAVRGHVAPEQNDDEATKLWDSLARVRPPSTPSETRPKPPTTAETMDPVARALLGKDRRSNDPAAVKRMGEAILLMVNSLDHYDKELRNLRVELRRSEAERERGGTLFEIQNEPPLAQLLALAADGGDGLAKLETRLNNLFGAIFACFKAHENSVKKATKATARILEPNRIQQKHGTGAWKEYRRLYTNQLYEFGPNFAEEFVVPHFVEEFLRPTRKTRKT